MTPLSTVCYPVPVIANRLDDLDTTASDVPSQSPVLSRAHTRRFTTETLQWLLIPLCAVAAYASVLRIGFLADDYPYLLSARTQPLGLQTLLPEPTWFFYHPLGTLFTWVLGVRIWGDIPLYYHLVSLLAHALTSLVLGLLVAEITSRRLLGVLTGLVFAVFPLHMEAVGWIAAQWDVLSTCLGLLSLWLYSKWFLRLGSGTGGRWWLYALAVFSYGLALFTKESVLTLPILFGLLAVLVSPEVARKHWKLVSLSLVPFGLLVSLNLLLRWLTWGNLGSYPGIRTDYTNLFWDNSLTIAHMLLSPINPELFGSRLVQAVGALSSVALFFGLVRFGRVHTRLIALSVGWLVVTTLPMINIPINLKDLQQNRLLYLPSAGYCLLIAVLLYATCESLVRLRLLDAWEAVSRRAIAYAGVAVLLLAGIVMCWQQLGPWHTATAQVEALNKELVALVPRPPGSEGMTWYVQNVPETYKGAYLLRIGLEGLRYQATGEIPNLVVVKDATKAPLAGAERNAYAMSFDYDKEANRFYVNYVAGITGGDSVAIPTPEPDSDFLQSWDFAKCAPGPLMEWKAIQVSGGCQPGSGLEITPVSNVAYLVSQELAVPEAANAPRFLRIRTAVRYPAAPGTAVSAQWYWTSGSEDFTEDRSRSLPIEQDGQSNVYWVFVPLSEVEGNTVRLRFDPVDETVMSTIQWISVDTVP